jgi:hypothetical protein
MQYLLLLYNDEEEFWSLPDDERKAIRGEYFALVDDLGSTYVGGAPLQPTTTATTMRVRDDEQVVTDGPFAETKEQLGGYFLVDVDSIDDALEIAARIPAARWGSVEVRPLVPVPARTEV